MLTAEQLSYLVDEITSIRNKGNKSRGISLLRQDEEVTPNVPDFFPGYVLVEMEMNDDTWHIVKECPKVLGFIGGTPEKPAPISQREADAILARVRNTGEAPRPKTMFEPGEELLVIDGPFTDFKGVVEEVQYEKSRLTLTINVFNRPTQVELEFRQVEKTV